MQWLKATEGWQIMIVRAFPEGEDRWRTRVASGLSLFFGPFLIFMGVEFWLKDAAQPMLDLPQMTKLTGVLVEVHHRGRGLGNSGFTIRQADGREVLYTDTLSFTYDKLRSQIGKPITVWSQPGFAMLWGGSYESPMQIQAGSWLIEDYAQIRPNLEKYDTYRHKIYYTFLGLGLFLPLRVWWKHRKPTSTQS
ncbi:MAG: hypothetical protein Q8M09_06850 [Pseudomonadota bacterium]|nr:hypothetical protein [Pseudomonadota bacterium]MDP2351996.1 hypothetical protein [Pseudomonadota bacterium]